MTHRGKSNSNDPAHKCGGPVGPTPFFNDVTPKYVLINRVKALKNGTKCWAYIKNRTSIASVKWG